MIYGANIPAVFPSVPFEDGGGKIDGVRSSIRVSLLGEEGWGDFYRVGCMFRVCARFERNWYKIDPLTIVNGYHSIGMIVQSKKVKRCSGDTNFLLFGVRVGGRRIESLKGEKSREMWGEGSGCVLIKKGIIIWRSRRGADGTIRWRWLSIFVVSIGRIGGARWSVISWHLISKCDRW